jgi:hypothetical protein
MRGGSALLCGLAPCLLIAGCGTTKPIPHRVNASRPSVHVSVKPDATPQAPTDPSTGATLTDCGRDVYATSCRFAEAAVGVYTAGASQITVEDSSGQQYTAQCSSASASTAACYVGTGVYGGYGGAYAIFPANEDQAATTQPTTEETSPPPAAECSALYAQWQADGEQEDQAIQEYGRIGCGQSNPDPTDDWCKTVTADNGSIEAVCDFPPNTPGAFAPNS